MKALYKNKWVTLQQNDEDRIELLDSDDNFIDYYFYSSDKSAIQEVIDALDCITSENEMVQYIVNVFWVVTNVASACNDEELQKLYDEYGEEFVCRIGKSAIILNQN